MYLTCLGPQVYFEGQGLCTHRGTRPLVLTCKVPEVPRRGDSLTQLAMSIRSIIILAHAPEHVYRTGL